MVKRKPCKNYTLRLFTSYMYFVTPYPQLMMIMLTFLKDSYVAISIHVSSTFSWMQYVDVVVVDLSVP